MTETETKYQCKTCDKLYETEEKAMSHTKNHKRKGPVRKRANGNPNIFVREVEVRKIDHDEKDLYELAGESPPDESDPEYLTHNDPPDGEDADITSYDG